MMAHPGDLSMRAPVTGALPSALIGGRLWSNGPGWTWIGDRLAHPFDGHGYLRRFTFTESGIQLDARFVNTPAYQAESAAGRMIYRGLATNISDRFWDNMGITGPPRNVANTTVVPWNGHILAGWEGGAPHAVDPTTLHTVGEYTFGGSIAGQASLAHMYTDPSCDSLLLCSIRMGRRTTVTFREVAPDETVTRSRTAEMPSLAFAHDFAFTKDWYVLGGNPISMKPFALAQMAVGTGTLMQALRTDLRRPGELVLISRHRDAPPRRVPLPGPAFVVHFANAFERDDALIVDACLFSRFSFGGEFGYTGPHSPLDPALPEARGPQKLVRITIPHDDTAASWQPLVPHGVDFPRVDPAYNGKDAPFLLGATRADTRYSDPFDSIIRVDLQAPHSHTLWTAPDGQFVGEPIGIQGTDGEHIVALLSDGVRQHTTVAVFNADTLSDGPIATAQLPLLPVAFHGEWQPPPRD